MAKEFDVDRRGFIQKAGVALAGAVIAVAEGSKLVEAAATSFQDGKHQEFSRDFVKIGNDRYPVLHNPDAGTLGPDTDLIFGLDFQGDLPTGVPAIHQPEGEVQETRVVGIKRTDLETVQFQDALGGDFFEVYKISDHGGDKALDDMARLHAANSAREHQKVIYVGDLGLFQKQWGDKEKSLLQRIIRAQRPGNADLGLPKSDFVNARIF